MQKILSATIFFSVHVINKNSPRLFAATNYTLLKFIVKMEISVCWQ
jgi:hypothetical protein